MPQTNNHRALISIIILVSMIAFLASSSLATSGLFLEPLTFSVGNGPSSVAVGDFNHDEKLDLAVTNQSDNTVSILLGKGKGTFSAATNFHATSPGYVATGDFNNDGNLDLVTVAANSNSISILLGDGKGGFGTQSTILIEGASQCSEVTVGDFNKDENLDIAVACGASNGAIAILLGKGDGTFQSPTLYGSADVCLVTADMNGDGIPDLVGANAGGLGVDVWLGKGDGTFQPPLQFGTGSPWGTAWEAVGDFNKDGSMDVAASVSPCGLGANPGHRGADPRGWIPPVSGAMDPSNNRPYQTSRLLTGTSWISMACWTLASFMN